MSSAGPRLFGPYVLLRKLGEGGMGTVYAAEDRRAPGTLVAVKLISDPSAGSVGDDSTLRFLRESKILASLRHPNIVTLFETGVVLGERYVAMELLKGRTLAAFAGLPWPRTVPLFVQVCRGLDYLASKGIVHRDLSPENVFVVSEGPRKTAKILDFGIAKDTTAQETLHDFTRTGVLMGKPPYWSPEQIELESGDTLDWRSDLYTLGVIFYRVLSGELPFVAESPAEYIPLHLFRPPPPLEAPPGHPPLPGGLVELVHRMLAKQKEDRPESYEEVIAVLDEALRLAPPSADEAEDAREAGGLRTKPTAPWETEATRAFDGGTLAAEPGTVALGPSTRGDDTAPTVLTRRPEPVAGRRALALGALGAIAAVLGTVVALVRPWAHAPEVATLGPPTPPPVAAAAVTAPSDPAAAPAFERSSPSPEPMPAPGTLAVDAIPWGRVVAVIDLASGRALPVPADPVTPLRLELPPGRYRLEVARDGNAERARSDVTVVAGTTRVVTLSLGETDAAASLLD